MAEVPAVGCRYDRNTKRLIKDDVIVEESRDNENEADARLAVVLKDIADDVKEEIKMEADCPSWNTDSKMAILDMEVWMGQENRILYQHYEKAVASKQILNAGSAQSGLCKKNVHVREIIRRILNTSVRLEWDIYVTPVLTEFMKRMELAGYNQGYRRNTLQHALGIYDNMKKEHELGVKPLNRPKSWQREKRDSEKRKKRKSWSTRGGCVAPIFVPCTPRGELAAELREIARKEAVAGLNFKIVEMGGVPIKRLVQKSNPTATPGCDSTDCLPCSNGRGRGGNCRKSNVQYQLECALCPDTDTDGCIYVGESSRNLYTRSREHISKYESRKLNKDSFIKKHQIDAHNDRPAQFKAKVTGVFKDCLSRQISEGVEIRRSSRNVLHSKSEWHQPALWRVQSEIVRE